MGASNLVPLVILFVVVAGMGWVGYQVRLSPDTSIIPQPQRQSHLTPTSHPQSSHVQRIPSLTSHRYIFTLNSSPSVAYARWRRRMLSSPRTARALVSRSSAPSRRRIARSAHLSRHGIQPRRGAVRGRGGLKGRDEEDVGWARWKPGPHGRDIRGSGTACGLLLNLAL